MVQHRLRNLTQALACLAKEAQSIHIFAYKCMGSECLLRTSAMKTELSADHEEELIGQSQETCRRHDGEARDGLQPTRTERRPNRRMSEMPVTR